MTTFEYFSVSLNTVIEVRSANKKKSTGGNCIFFLEKKVKTSVTNQYQECFANNSGNKFTEKTDPENRYICILFIYSRVWFTQPFTCRYICILDQHLIKVDYELL